jgi:signal transduction histidine kinase
MLQKILFRTIYLPFFFSFVFLQQANGQYPDPLVKINGSIGSFEIQKPAKGFVPLNFDIAKNYSEGTLSQKPFYKKPVPVEFVSQKLLIRFKIYNEKEYTDSIYVFPGLFFNAVSLYKIENDRAIPLPSVLPPIKDSISFRRIMLEPKDTMTLLIECVQARTYTNQAEVKIIEAGYVKAFLLEYHDRKKYISLFTFVFCGLLMMMVLFSMANFLQGGNSEFLYYAGYALFLSIMLFTKQYYYNRPVVQNFLFETFLDFILQGIGIIFFMAFMLRFLETKTNFPFLHKIYLGGIVFLVGSLALYTFIHFSSIDYYWEHFLENIVIKNVLIGLIVVFLIYAFINRRYKLMRYLFWGNLLFLFCSMLSLVILLQSKPLSLPGILKDGLVYYQLGLFFELIFFLMGLIYKNRMQLIEQTRERERLKIENERKELEKQMAVMQAHQEERERISADIHDELGSGMTTIRLMSEIAKNKMKGEIPVEIEKISGSANEVLNKMNAIIWSMNSSNDTLDSLVSYIRSYATEFFDGTHINCNISTPEKVSTIEINGDKRRNIFLCVKESLNNIIKHAAATEVNISMETNHHFVIIIKDNGIGIQEEKISRFGNGLKNIARRMRTIGGEYTIKNIGGTETKLILPLY